MVETCSYITILLFLIVGTGAVYLDQMRYNEYDYIIVGAGSTGSVIASRLSEDQDTRVLLLEAGGLPDDFSEVPLFATDLMGSAMDWGYYTEPEKKACLALEGRRNYLPRGKTLGGSSVLNFMAYVRGAHRDFDEWSRDGATGWSWNEVLPYFKKSEDQTDPELLRNGYHSEGGPLTVSSLKFGTPVREAFLEAGRYLGHNVLKDVNADSILGFSKLQATIRDGLRCSTEKAFLRPAAHRDNLDILIQAHVTRINFDQTKRATSVSLEHRNSSRSISADKEIILSAGAIASPQLLMLSGVGPKKHLEELEIPVVSDLPVGENLQDHVMAGGLIYLMNSSSGLSQLRNFSRKAIGELVAGKGPLTVPAFTEGVAFVNTKYQSPSKNWPDMMIYLMSTLFVPQTNNKVSEFLTQYQDKDVVTLFATLSRPKSRGLIKLRSTDPHDHPIINARLLDEDEDLKRLVEGMKFVESIMKSPSFKRLGASRINIGNIGCDNLDVDKEEYLICLARSLTINMFHKSGTCKMGNALDKTAVLDPQLRVKGVTGLRVADLSIMPIITSGNTNAPCIMIGEKIADMIKKYAGNKDEH